MTDMGSNQSLFSVKMDSKCVPLAYRLCPKSLDDYVGQAHLLADTKPLSRLIQANHLVSILFWGPPGCGKTALSRLLARHFDVEFMALNAVMAKVQDIRDAIQEAKDHRVLGRRSLLFIDEIHRFNKAQQDALLPSVEKGDIVLFPSSIFHKTVPFESEENRITLAFDVKPIF